MAQIEYGFNIEKNTFLHISEVNSGLSELVCASCYEKGLKIQLVAAKGEINEHYFKHHNGDGHSGCGGGEGVLHLYVKNRILNEKKIYINDVEHIFSNCQLEYDFLGKKIDVCGFLANGNKIFLEIVVSHSMYNDKEGKEKIQLIQKSGILCYEIMIDETLTKEQIENGLFKNSKIIPKISIYQNNGTDFYFLMSNFTSRILAEKNKILIEKNTLTRLIKDNEYYESKIDELREDRFSLEDDLEVLTTENDELKGIYNTKKKELDEEYNELQTLLQQKVLNYENQHSLKLSELAKLEERYTVELNKQNEELKAIYDIKKNQLEMEHNINLKKYEDFKKEFEIKINPILKLHNSAMLNTKGYENLLTHKIYNKRNNISYEIINLSEK
jgi:hypothetical protein